MKQRLPISKHATYGDVRRISTSILFDKELLWWLIWLPLQSVEDLSRCKGSPSATVYEHLTFLNKEGLIEYVRLSEPGFSRHRRYYVSDLGLYVYAEQSCPPTNVQYLAQSYQIRERDLLTNIVHAQQLICLCDMISRLVEEGRARHYHLCSFRQPAQLQYRSGERKRTITADASISIEHVNGQGASFFVMIDVWEQTDIEYTQQRTWLINFLQMCDAAFWKRSSPFVPTPLIITRPERLFAWGELLGHVSHKLGMSLPVGGVTTQTRFGEGIYTPIWYSLSSVATWAREQEGTQYLLTPGLSENLPFTHFITDMCKPATQHISELDKQEALYQRLHRAPRTGAFPSTKRPLARYVHGLFQNMSQDLSTSDLWIERMEGSDFLQRYALLTLKLTAQEKEIISLLARHPFLSIPDLTAQLTPLARDTRSIETSINRLIHLELIATEEWLRGRTSTRRVRYLLKETAFHFLIERNNIPSTHYLGPNKEEAIDDNDAGGSLVPRGLIGLSNKMDHTVGVYQCMSSAIWRYHQQQDVHLLWWKSARESVRSYYNPETNTQSYLRPDGEVCYILPGQTSLNIFLIEYDRATTSRRDYIKKFASYRKYYKATGRLPHPILVITQDKNTAQKIRSIAAEIEKRLTVVIVLEKDLLRGGIAKSILEATL